MRKIILLVAIALISNLTFAQTVNGIELGKPLSETIAKVKAKGFTFNYSEASYTSYNGKIGNEKVNFTLYFTPKTKIVWKILVIMLKPHKSWSSTLSDYNKYKNILVEKYGEPSDDYHYFISPYYEGDGYEMQALDQEKCTYSAYFNLPNGNIASVSIGKSSMGLITIDYENVVAGDLRDKEKSDIDNKVF